MKYIWITLGSFFGLAALIYIIGWILPVSHTATVSAEVDLPVEMVWTTITSPENFPDWRSDVSRVEVSSDSGETLRWTEYYKNGEYLPFKEVSRIDSSVFISDIISDGLPFGGRWTISLEEKNNITLVTITEDGEVYSPVFRFFSKFVFGHESTMRQYLQDLKSVSQ